jgi:hypothetical protein
MAKRGFSVYMFDHTVGKPPIDHAEFNFSSRGLAGVAYQSGTFVTLRGIIDELAHQARSDIILKMDIEGAEYGIFNGIDTETLYHFSQLVIEFHDLASLADPSFRQRFTDTLLNINKVFTAYHVHSNNCAPLAIVDGYVVPSVLEMSYVRSDLVDRVPSNTLYPTELDFPNWPAEPDHLLWFFPFMPLRGGDGAQGYSFRNSIAWANRVIG